MMPRFSFVCSQLYKMLHFSILVINISNCSSDNADTVAQNHLKIAHVGDSVNLTCNFPKDQRTSTVWVKQRVGEKPLPIVSSYQGLPGAFENDFNQHKRYFIVKDNISFNLSITDIEESDTATYYCIQHFFKFTIGDGTDLIVKGRHLNMQSDHERAVLDPVHPEDSEVALQCTVLTQSCAGEHNVYWFRRESGESPPGIIFTRERRNAQCERSSDVNSTEHRCIYSLPKRNLSHSDAGIYYCAVAACGQIQFGDAITVDLPDKCFQTHWITAALIMVTLSVIVIIIMGAQLYKYWQKDGMHNTLNSQLTADNTDALNYAALSLQQKPSTCRRPRERKSQDNSLEVQYLKVSVSVCLSLSDCVEKEEKPVIGST
uniref:Ig-like domain-containing protein n=1 Tax=Cyprinus carpio TaxID=7962 RepID=A0A8C1J6Q0_CYPCA